VTGDQPENEQTMKTIFQSLIDPKRRLGYWILILSLLGVLMESNLEGLLLLTGLQQLTIASIFLKALALLCFFGMLIGLLSVLWSTILLLIQEFRVLQEER
jgi:hypothetical protein